MTDMSLTVKRLKALMKEHKVELVLISQVANPYSCGGYRAPSWDRDYVTIDYMHVIDSLDGLIIRDA